MDKTNLSKKARPAGSRMLDYLNAFGQATIKGQVWMPQVNPSLVPAFW